MKKVVILLVMALIVMCTATPVSAADIYLSSLRINEELIPGPTDQTLTVTGILSNGVEQGLTGSLIWRSSDYDIAKVSTSGRVHFTGKGGTVTITVSRGAVVGTKTVYVKPWPVWLDIETSLVYGQNPYRLQVKGKFSDGQERYFGPEDNLAWTTTNPFVAWVNSQGVVTFTGEPGYVQIGATWGNLYDWAVVSVPETGGEGGDIVIPAYRIGIAIKEEDIQYSKDPQKLTLVSRHVDDTTQDIPSVGADWSSSNPEIATISSEGELKFTGKQGVTAVTVKYGGFTYTRNITVGRFLQSLKINQSLNFTPDWEGVPLQLTVRGKYNDGTEIPLTSGLTWTVDNKKVADITSDGLLAFSGEMGIVNVKATAAGFGELVLEDSVTVNVPDYPKARPQRFFVTRSIYNTAKPIEPKAYCIYDNGAIRDVTEETRFNSLTPEGLSVYQGKLYVSPNPGQIHVRATYRGLSDELSGFVNVASPRGNWVQQVFIREHSVAFTYRQVPLAALAVISNGSIKDVTANVKWSSNQPQVARISKGVLTFTGRAGTAVITMQGFGFRDQIILEVTPAELAPRVEKLEIVGSLTKAYSPLKAVATFNDGTVKDVSNEAVWNTNNREYVAVIKGDVMFSQGQKPVTVTVNYGGFSAKATNF